MLSEPWIDNHLSVNVDRGQSPQRLLFRLDRAYFCRSDPWHLVGFHLGGFLPGRNSRTWVRSGLELEILFLSRFVDYQYP
jgi:hypothetical protein